MHPTQGAILRRITIIALLGLTSLVSAPPAAADYTPLSEKYLETHTKCDQKLGDRACGRNAVTMGVRWLPTNDARRAAQCFRSARVRPQRSGLRNGTAPVSALAAADLASSVPSAYAAVASASRACDRAIEQVTTHTGVRASRRRMERCGWAHSTASHAGTSTPGTRPKSCGRALSWKARFVGRLHRARRWTIATATAPMIAPTTCGCSPPGRTTHSTTSRGATSRSLRGASLALDSRPATAREKAKSVHTMRRMLRLAPRAHQSSAKNMEQSPRNGTAPRSAGGPEQFVGCESGGDWNARNPSSGAFGRYQLMPQHYQGSGLCSGLGQDPSGQTRCANRVYEEQGSGAWSACGG